MEKGERSNLKENEFQALTLFRALLGVMILLNEIPKKEGHKSASLGGLSPSNWAKVSADCVIDHGDL